MSYNLNRKRNEQSYELVQYHVPRNMNDQKMNTIARQPNPQFYPTGQYANVPNGHMTVDPRTMRSQSWFVPDGPINGTTLPPRFSMKNGTDPVYTEPVYEVPTPAEPETGEKNSVTYFPLEVVQNTNSM